MAWNGETSVDRYRQSVRASRRQHSLRSAGARWVRSIHGKSFPRLLFWLVPAVCAYFGIALLFDYHGEIWQASLTEQQALSLGSALLASSIVPVLFGGGSIAADSARERRELKTKLSTSTDLRGADLAGTNLRGIYLPDARLDGARLSRSSASDAYLVGASLRQARLTKAGLRSAHLSRSDLSDVAGYKVDLREADLRLARLAGADLARADLRGAQLMRADLSEADLRGADLRGTNLTTTVLADAWYDRKTKWPDGFVLPTRPDGPIRKTEHDREHRMVVGDRRVIDLRTPSGADTTYLREPTGHEIAAPVRSAT